MNLKKIMDDMYYPKQKDSNNIDAADDFSILYTFNKQKVKQKHSKI